MNPKSLNLQPTARRMLLRQLHHDLERALAGVMADLADDHQRLLHDLQACDVMVDALRYAACMTISCGPMFQPGRTGPLHAGVSFFCVCRVPWGSVFKRKES